MWATRIRAAPISYNSAVLVKELTEQVRSGPGGNAAFNVWRYNTSVVTAAKGQPRVDVSFANCQHKPSTPAGLEGPGGQFTAVPIPVDALPAAGTDAELTVYSPSTDQLWEFWKVQHTEGRWSACWGGRLNQVSRSLGYFQDGFGASASGIATLGGIVTIADARVGRIDHGLALAIVDPAPWNQVSWPAQRSDGSPSSTSAVAEGTRFRLDPAVDVDKLNLSPLGKTIARAAQQYGFIVTDKAGAVSVIAQSGAVAAAKNGTDPWGSILGGVASYNVLKGFPWASLQALPKNYGRPITAGAS